MLLLNLMVPATCVIFYLAGNLVALFVGMLLTLQGSAVPVTVAHSVGLALALLASISGAWFAVRRRAALPHPLPGKAVAGHALIACATAGVVVATVRPFAAAYLTGKQDYVMFFWYALLVMPCAAVAWLVGWCLIGGQRPSADRRIEGRASGLT